MRTNGDQLFATKSDDDDDDDDDDDSDKGCWSLAKWNTASDAERRRSDNVWAKGDTASDARETKKEKKQRWTDG